MRQRVGIAVRAALAAAALVAPRLSASPLRVAAQAGGPTTSVAVHGSYVYAGIGYRLAVYDVSRPEAPLLVGTSAAFPDFVLGVATDGAIACVAAGRAGLRVVDVTDPTRPTEIGSWDSPGSAEGVALAGTTAFLADGPFGLRAVELSDPARPVPMGSAFDTRFAVAVAVEAGRACVAGAGSGLLVADVRDPARLVELGSVDTPGFARSVAVSGDVAWVADSWGGLRAVTIADPARPAEMGSLALPSWAFGVALDGSTLYVADGSQGLRIVDAADPSHPREVGAYPVTWQHAGAVAVADGRAFLATRGEGFHVVDVRAPSAPRLLAVASQLAEARAATALGDVAYVAAADQGLRVLDLAAGAREIGRVDAGEFAYCAATMGERTLVVGSTGTGAGIAPGLHFFDLSDPRQPRKRGFLSGAGINPTDISVQGSLVAISGEPGIHLIDASDPGAPVVLSFLNLTAGSPLVPLVWDVALAGSTACVAQSGDGLRLVDVTNPRDPKVVGTYKPDTLSSAYAVAAAGPYAYVAGGSSGLHVVDISDPRSPRTVAVLRPLLGVERMRLSGTTLLVAAGAGGLVAVDVADPAKPVVSGSYRLPGFTFGVGSASGGRVLAASGEAGLFVVDQVPGGSTGAVTPPPGAGLRSEAPGAAEPAGALVRRIAADFEDSTRAAATRLAAERSALLARRSGPSLSARTLVVTSAADSGAGTLREALATASAGDTVTFDATAFPPASPTTIPVATQLPCVCRDGLTIDASNAGVVVDGSRAPSGTIGFVVASNDSRVKGLTIVGFDHSGIWVSGSRNVIGGDRARGAGPSGEGNVVSGNRFSGINFPDAKATGNRIVGNLVGTDAAGTRPYSRPQYIGVFFYPGGPGNTAGGTEPWEANVISGNAVAEVFFQQARADTVVGNFIGTDPTGTRRVGSAPQGIGTGGHSSDHLISGNVIVASGQAVIVSDSGSFYNQIVGNRIGIGRDGAPLAAADSGNHVGVAVSQSYNRIADNVISGNPRAGITFGFWGSHDSVVTGNLVGTDPSGTQARPNGLGGGMSLLTLSHGFVGGAGPGEANVVSGNAGSGIVLSGPGPVSNFVLGNLVGSDVTGRSALGNGGFGVELGAADGNFVQGNVLAFSAWNGAYSTESSGNRLRRNSIHSNGNGGIVAGPGSDQLPAPPTITSVTATTASGTACAACTVEVFSDSGAQGKTFEGEAVTNSAGAFRMQKASGALAGPNLTATASDRAGSTSAFSARVVLPSRPATGLVLVGTAEGLPGSTVPVVLSFEAGGASVTAFTADLAFASPPFRSAPRRRARRGPARGSPSRPTRSPAGSACASAGRRPRSATAWPRSSRSPSRRVPRPARSRSGRRARREALPTARPCRSRRRPGR